MPAGNEIKPKITTEEAMQAYTVGKLEPRSGPILLVQYDPAWPVLFDGHAAKVRGALGDRVRLLEHVGSTSVPGLCAKPQLDLVLALDDSANEPSYLPDLEQAGYVRRKARASRRVRVVGVRHGFRPLTSNIAQIGERAQATRGGIWKDVQASSACQGASRTASRRCARALRTSAGTARRNGLASASIPTNVPRSSCGSVRSVTVDVGAVSQRANGR